MVKIQSLGPLTDNLFITIIQTVGDRARRNFLTNNQYLDQIQQLCDASAEDEYGEDWWDLEIAEQEQIEENFERNRNKHLLSLCKDIDLIGLMNYYLSLDNSIENLISDLEDEDSEFQIVLQVSPTEQLSEDNEDDDEEDEHIETPLITFVNSGRRK